MKPEFKHKDSFKAIGVTYRGNPDGKEIPDLWLKFGPMIKTIPNHEGDISYGIIRGFEGAKHGEFEYIAAINVSKLDEIPEGMTGIEVPANNYAVFTHKGPISTIQNTVRFVYDKWWKENAENILSAPNFELYDEHFKMEDPESEMYIYIPVKQIPA